MTQKVEVTDEFIKIPNPKFSGDCIEIRTIVLSERRGVTALLCLTSKKIKTYMFDKTKWSVSEAKDWVTDNAKSFKGLETVAKTHKTPSGRLVAVASEEVEDRDGEVISADGWELANFKKNPVLLWMHNRVSGHNGLPIGHAENLRFRTTNGRRKLTFSPVFDDSTDFNRTVKKFYEELGVMNSFSVGFLPKEREGNRYTKQELLEISAVPVPALASARVISAAKEIGISAGKALAVVECSHSDKATIPYRAYEPAPETRAWDAAGAVARVRRWSGGPDKDKINWTVYRECFTWYDSKSDDSFGSYKLPHHDISGSELVTVWRGVISAMAALLGARGDIEIPDQDKRKIYNHLAKHYVQFGREAPDFKMVEDQELKDVFEIVKEEAVSATNKEMLNLMREVKKRTVTERQNKAAKQKEAEDEVVEALKILNKAFGSVTK